SVSVNSAVSGRVPNGATVERMIPSDFADRPEIMLNLRSPGFQTVTNIVRAINEHIGSDDVAVALNATKVAVRAPVTSTQRMGFMALLEMIDVDEGRERPKVVFNSRTGTVVMGEGVRVKTAAVA